jgi:hypothetical protein
VLQEVRQRSQHQNKTVSTKTSTLRYCNGAVIGVAPPELTDLNDVELALVSLARANKHIFAFYGGAHKSMHGWHNLYENDVEGIARTLNQVSEYTGDNVILCIDNVILCILLGPFTPLQKQFVKNNMLVKPTMFFVRFIG